jgi:hypothetical protein
MQPISLVTKGFISTLNKFYQYPFDVTIDYGAKDISVLLEDIDLLVETEQEILTVEAGQEDLTVEIESINVDVKLD